MFTPHAWRAVRAHLIAFALSACFIGAADAAQPTVSGGWIRSLPGGPAGGYFTLTNDTGRPIVLVGASSPACGMLMLHKTESMGGMSTMEDVANIPVAPGGTLTFAPGGYHLMCMDPTALIRPGNKVLVTLIFEDGSKVTSPFIVRGATGH